MEHQNRKPNRLKSYDYSLPNAYFITICTHHRKPLFWVPAGKPVRCAEDVVLSPWGHIVQQVIQEIPCHYPAVSDDHYTVMPDHVHLLLRIHGDNDGRRIAAPTISRVVNQMKGNASRRAGVSLWQKGYYDHVVRSDADYLEIWNYISGNPGEWAEKKGYAEDHGY